MAAIAARPLCLGSNIMGGVGESGLSLGAPQHIIFGAG